jgi:hypothetical protein
MKTIMAGSLFLAALAGCGGSGSGSSASAANVQKIASWASVSDPAISGFDAWELVNITEGTKSALQARAYRTQPDGSFTSVLDVDMWDAKHATIAFYSEHAITLGPGVAHAIAQDFTAAAEALKSPSGFTSAQRAGLSLQDAPMGPLIEGSGKALARGIGCIVGGALGISAATISGTMALIVEALGPADLYCPIAAATSAFPGPYGQAYVNCVTGGPAGNAINCANASQNFALYACTNNEPLVDYDCHVPEIM